MSEITRAMTSPSMVNGILHFYEGDTFTINFLVRMKDQDGEEIEIESTDKIEFVYYDKKKQPVYTKTIFGSDLETRDGKKYADIEFNSTVTAYFKRGHYTYRVKFTHDDKTTTHEAELIVL